MKIENVQTLQCEITSYCNAKCPHCPRFEPDGSLKANLKLSHWDYKKILDSLQLDKMTNLKLVILEGDKGDPCMHPNLDEIIIAFLNSPGNPNVSLTTNGSIQNSDWWKKLAKFSDRLTVTFSVDGLEDTNNVYRVKTNYKKIVENYTSFISNGGKAVWKFIVFQHNQHQINEAKKLARQIGFESIKFRHPFLERFLDNYQWPIFDKNKFLGNLSPPTLSSQEIIKNSENFVKLHPPQQVQKLQVYDNVICPNLSVGHFYITHDHNVFPCCMMHNVLNDTGNTKKKIMSILEDVSSINLLQNDFSTVLKSKFYQINLEKHFFTGAHHPICHKSCYNKIVPKIKKIKSKNI